eukprot:s2876_g7.t1
MKGFQFMVQGHDPAAQLPLRGGFSAFSKTAVSRFIQSQDHVVTEVSFFSYTLHVCDKALELKCGTAVVLRRGCQEFSLLSYLVHAELIMACTNACLTELLLKHDITMPKNSAKAHRIKRILDMDHVKEACGPKKIQKLLGLLQEQETKKKGKAEAEEEPNPEAFSSSA